MAQQSPPARVGSVTGIVGAAGLALLAAVAAAAMIFTATTVRRATQRPVPATAAGPTG